MKGDVHLHLIVMHNKLASSIFCAEQDIHYIIIGHELQNLTNTLISKDFSHQSSTTSNNTTCNTTKRFSIANCNKHNDFQFLSNKQSTGSWFLHARKAQQALDCICLSVFRLISFRWILRHSALLHVGVLIINGAVIKSQLQLLSFFFHCTWGKPL